MRTRLFLKHFPPLNQSATNLFLYLVKKKRFFFRLKNLSKYIVYLLIDLDGGKVSLSLVANQRRGFREIRHCDWLSPKVEHFRRRGRLVDIDYGPSVTASHGA